MDRYDHKPHLNTRLFLLLASGVGLRQSARVLNLSNRCTELKARKIGRHLRRLNCNLMRQLSEDARLQFDELHTYEGCRSTRPLSLAVMIETESRYILWAESATIRPHGKMTKRRRKKIAEEESKYGPRVDRSRYCVERTFRRIAALTSELRSVFLSTDERPTYRGLAEKAFGESRLVHVQTPGRIARMTWNPLFAINHTEAMARDLIGRLRRNSWLVSKKQRYLDIAMHALIAFRNLVRRRFNGDRCSPAQLLGWMPRRLTPGELLSWRQDGGDLSIHPLAKAGEAVGDGLADSGGKEGTRNSPGNTETGQIERTPGRGSGLSSPP